VCVVVCLCVCVCVCVCVGCVPGCKGGRASYSTSHFVIIKSVAIKITEFISRASSRENDQKQVWTPRGSRGIHVLF